MQAQHTAPVTAVTARGPWRPMMRPACVNAISAPTPEASIAIASACSPNP